eukprot:TRINITY_DN17749_c0_g1_i1.p1 TRINITY_DN17749_c0_g1~~TRINITY_DN17749_c0_g1_i1.p1  ORF type:complete len:410 (+),score=96.35 TRINITY_DN17749_c0_g1_i1:49-1278(+)
MVVARESNACIPGAVSDTCINVPEPASEYPDGALERQRAAGAAKVSVVSEDSAAAGAPLTRTVSGSTESSGEAAVRVFRVSYAVRFGGAMLAFCAGIVNAVAMHALNTFVSHATGTLTKVGLGLEDDRWSPADSVLLLLAFLLGSTYCGLLVGKSTIHFGLALYDFCLLSIAALLVATYGLADAAPKAAARLAAAACGLQNGMATNWGGAVIRTTHVTGLFTDLGLLVGRLSSMLMRKRCGKNFDLIDHAEVADDLSKLSVLFTIACFFLIGVYIGALLHGLMGVAAFLVPAAFTGSAGVVYLVYRVFILHQSLLSDLEMEVVDVEVNNCLQIACSDESPRQSRGTASISEDDVHFARVGSKTSVHGGSPVAPRQHSRAEVRSVPRDAALRSASKTSAAGEKKLSSVGS